jgi:CBS domain-containing protein
LLLNKDVRAVPIVDGTRLIGIVSRRDMSVAPQPVGRHAVTEAAGR